jgi:hypothetical protein
MSGGAEALRSLAREPHATHIRSFMAIVALLRIAVLSPLTLLEAHLASIIDAERLRLWAFGEDDPKIGQGYVNAVLGDEPLDVVPAALSARLADNRQRRDAHVSEGQAVAGHRLMDRPLIPVERRNEVGAHQGALTVLRMVAIGAWHAGAAAAFIFLAAPRLVGVVLAHPTGVLAAATLRHGGPRRGHHTRVPAPCAAQVRRKERPGDE